MPIPADPPIFYCPRCDRPYVGKTAAEVEEHVKNHVAGAHPDHDPDWDETYPDNTLKETT